MSLVVGKLKCTSAAQVELSGWVEPLGERQKVCLKSSGLRCSLTHSSFRPQNFLVLVMMSLIPSSEGLEKSNLPSCREIIWDKSKKHGLEEVKFQSQFPVLCLSNKGQYYSLFV